jgi:hypothetical protein
MSIFLTAWGFVAAGYLIVAFTAWPSPIYEIEAGIRFLIATLAIAGARLSDAPKKSVK